MKHANRDKMCCPYGHPLDGLYRRGRDAGRRYCKTCRRIKASEYRRSTPADADHRPLALIHKVTNAEPHQLLAAAVLSQAQADRDVGWLATDDALMWCELLTRGTMEPTGILKRLAA